MLITNNRYYIYGIWPNKIFSLTCYTRAKLFQGIKQNEYYQYLIRDSHCLKGGQAIMRHPFPHNDVINWTHFPHYWPLVRGIHRSSVNSPHKGQWRGALVFSLICARINGWVNNREADDLRRYRACYDVIVMPSFRHLNTNYIPCQLDI